MYQLHKETSINVYLVFRVLSLVLCTVLALLNSALIRTKVRLFYNDANALVVKYNNGEAID